MKGSSVMSTLTKKEREGLNEVFLSIHTHNHRYKKIKELSKFIVCQYKIFKKAKFSKHSFLSHRS